MHCISTCLSLTGFKQVNVFLFLQIRNGNGPNAPLMGKYCGTQIPPDMTSTGHTLYLRFKTDYSVQGTGFKLSFESIDSGSGPNGEASNFGVSFYFVRNGIRLHTIATK